MMEKCSILVKRIYKNDKYTIGKMYVNGNYLCDTLEDTVRDLNTEEKVYGQTAIPAGKYKVILTHSPHFDRVLPELLEVPHFSKIRIHAGNTVKDTLGCILVGENKVKGMVVNSRFYENKLMCILFDKKEIEIEIV